MIFNLLGSRSQRFVRLTQLSMTLLVSFSIASCYIESNSDRKKDDNKKDLTLTDTNPPSDRHEPKQQGNCQVSATTGCYEGEIPASPKLRVEDKEFFDANDLRDRFAELITIKSEDETVLKRDEYTVTLQTSFDNRSFGSEFEVYLKGESATNGKTSRRGGFSIDRIYPGSYDVRISRPIHFTVTRKIVTPAPQPNPDQPEGTTPVAPVEEVVKKEYCAALYSDTSIEVEVGERVREVFDNYKLFVTDKSCGSDDITDSGVTVHI